MNLLDKCYGRIYCLDNSDSIGIPLEQLFCSDIDSSGCLASSEDPFCIIYTAAKGGKSRIDRYKKPRYVQFVDILPNAADGSIDRAKVIKHYG